MRSTRSTSPRPSRSPAAAASTSRGSRCRTRLGTALNGNETYDRFNPIIGGTYKITPELTAYAGYSEANRAPTPLELGCADPAHPCIIAAFLVSDPPLKQVVSHTVEAGLRGTKELNIGTLDWKLGGFRATNTDDILAIPEPVIRASAISRTSARPAARASRPRPSCKSDSVAALCQLCVRRRALPRRAAGRLQQPVRRRQRQHPGPARQPDSGDAAPPDQGRHRLFASPTRSRSAATRCSSAASISSVTNPTRRRSCRPMPSSTSTPPIRSTRRSRSTAGSTICFDNRYATYGTFFDNRGAEFRQWRRAVHRPALAEPGAAARVLCGHEGDVLKRDALVSRCSLCGQFSESQPRHLMTRVSARRFAPVDTFRPAMLMNPRSSLSTAMKRLRLDARL